MVRLSSSSRASSAGKITGKPWWLSKRKIEKNKRIRAKGAGRKVPFPEIIAELKQWLSIERACGHRISKVDPLAEFLSHLQKKAIDLRKQAEDPNISPFIKAQPLSSAVEREHRKEKLLKSQNYRKSQRDKLAQWVGAKFMSSELVANISATEAQTRCMLTWQEFDYTLWLATCSSEETLPKSDKHQTSAGHWFLRPGTSLG